MHAAGRDLPVMWPGVFGAAQVVFIREYASTSGDDLALATDRVMYATRHREPGKRRRALDQLP